MIHLDTGLLRARQDLERSGVRWALIGGLAVSVRAEPRPTRDIDFAVAVVDDDEAERLVRSLFSVGYRLLPDAGQLEQTDTGRLATVRLIPPGEQLDKIVVDLLFAACGIEPEIVAAAELLEVLPNILVPVATTGHLIAMKVLSASSKRRRDYDDIQALFREATPGDLEHSKAALSLIEKRGFHRGRNLLAELALILDE